MSISPGHSPSLVMTQKKSRNPADSYTKACIPVPMAALFVLTKTWKQPNTHQQVMLIQGKIAQ